MAIIRPFRGLRPKPELAEQVASQPYDVLNSAEARIEVEGNPHSFLHVLKAEVDLPEDTDVYSETVYSKAKENLEKMIEDGVMHQDEEPCMYLYRQIMNNRSQFGLVVCSSIEDYFNDVIKKHELTRPVKENDRINHMKAIGAHPGPVFLTYPDVEDIDIIISEYKGSNDAENDFTDAQGVQHTLWVIEEEFVIEELCRLFAEQVPATYIADGHHRAASSAKVGKAMADENSDHTGEEEYNYFLSVLFPSSQLMIIDYNRVLKDLNGLSNEEFLAKIGEQFDMHDAKDGPVQPGALHAFGLYIDHKWYSLRCKAGTYDDHDPIGILDVTILQENVFSSILNITDPRTDERVEFVGGIRGLGELEKLVDSGEMAAAFSMYPVTIQQLISISDSGNVMPPKSTWFEPKLKSGLVVHLLEN